MARPEKQPVRLWRIVFPFIKLGFTAFGGPAAAYALMRQEFVLQRKWLSDEKFFDYLGVANLVPGPNATEMAMMIGFARAGWWGLLLGGIFYILPAMLIVMVLAGIYVRFGALPALNGLLYGIKPVVVSVLISAMWGMLKPRVKNYLGLLVAAAVCAAYLLGISPFILLLAGGLILWTIRCFETQKILLGLSILWLQFPLRPLGDTLQPGSYSLLRLFWLFLKAGALMLGSGYVLLAFIQDDLVHKLGWLTQSQLVDAIAVGQVTPGPLSTTATFVGFVLGGVPAGILSTLAMFLPSFIVVIIVVRFIEKMRNSKPLAGILEGVSFAALGLMAGVTWEIGVEALMDPSTAFIMVISLFMILILNVNAPLLILGGGTLGLLRVIFFGG
ncbi:MAG: chromate efflux transporter [Brevefilum sp.]